MKINQKSIVLSVIVMFIISPVIINFILNSGPWFGIVAASENEWISFFGDYFGGIITAISLGITILYTTWQYKDHDRKRIQPYLTISQLHKIGPIDQTTEVENRDYKIGLIGVLNEYRNPDDDLGFKFPKIELFGELSNIGIGTAINITIHDITIEKRKFGDIEAPIRALSVDNKTYYRINLYEVYIESDYIREELIQNLKSEKINIPRLQLNFRLHYFDMLGNEYSQNVICEIQAIKNADQTYQDNVLFKDITFPKKL